MTDVRKHCEFGGMAGPVAEIKKLRTACLVATKGRLAELRHGIIDAGPLPCGAMKVGGIPVYTCDNDVDVMLRALELAKTTDEVWLAMDAGDQLVLMPSWIRDLYQQKGDNQ